MMWAVVVVLVLFLGLAYAQEEGCTFCDPSCGDWSCITNCSATTTNPTFDRMRCFEDRNGNGIIDDCREMPACQLSNGNWVCPTDINDPVCNGVCGYGNIRWKDTNPADFDAPYYTYAKSKYPISWSQYSSNSCTWQFPDVSRRYDIWNLYGSGPFWIRDGVLYTDVWFSFVSYGQYIDFSNRCWIVKDLQYSNFPYRWQRLGKGCIPRNWQSQFCVTAYRCSADGRYYRDYYTCYNNCQRWRCSLNGYYYSNYYSCYNSCVSGSTRGYCYNTAYCSASIQCTYFYWTANAPYTQTRYYYDWRTWTYYTVSLSCGSWQWIDAIYGCGASAYKQKKQVCTMYIENVFPTNEYGYMYPYTSFPYCYNYMSRYGYITRSSYTGTNFEQYGKVVENRTVPLNNYGILFYPAVKCRPCGTDLNSIGAGLTKTYDPPPQEVGNLDPAGVCRNFRFFGGELRRCRPGGITVLGASCCGISGWFKWMCKPEEKELKKKRYSGLCHYVGSYCSKKILGFCIERKRSYCCFYSRIGKIIQECGRPQVGRSWGSGKYPDCRGLKPEEFARINLNDDACRLALEEYMREVATGLDYRLMDMQYEAMERINSWLSNPTVNNFNNY